MTHIGNTLLAWNLRGIHEAMQLVQLSPCGSYAVASFYLMGRHLQLRSRVVRISHHDQAARCAISEKMSVCIEFSTTSRPTAASSATASTMCGMHSTIRPSSPAPASTIRPSTALIASLSAHRTIAAPQAAGSPLPWQPPRSIPSAASSSSRTDSSPDAHARSCRPTSSSHSSIRSSICSQRAHSHSAAAASPSSATLSSQCACLMHARKSACRRSSGMEAGPATGSGRPALPSVESPPGSRSMASRRVQLALRMR
mmetsp:Transcript_34812/g.87684  ORF Transcript_34812/g.87684 Transcript_34812/m.87684 type:complete len:256 (+) Transcript_34812:641-1408(+)